MITREHASSDMGDSQRGQQELQIVQKVWASTEDEQKSMVVDSFYDKAGVIPCNKTSIIFELTS